MKTPKSYYPTRHHGCNPIHPVTSWSKVRGLIRAARRGDIIPPIIIEGLLGNGNMLSGTHRSAANDIMMMLAGDDPRAALIPVVALDDIIIDYDVVARERILDAIADLDYERLNDFF